jgi:hypothetical protein
VRIEGEKRKHRGEIERKEKNDRRVDMSSIGD